MNNQDKICLNQLIKSAAVCQQNVHSLIKENNAAAYKKCIQLCSECVVMCLAASQMLSLESKMARQMAGLCAQICQACANECEKLAFTHPLCKECAEVCRISVECIS